MFTLVQQKALWSRLNRNNGATVYGLTDQIIISGASFAVTVLLTRSTSLDNFGTFSLLLTTILFLASVQNALICVPMTVIAAPLSPTQFRSATTSGSLLQALYSLFSFAAFALIAIALALASRSNTQLLILAGGVAAASQMQEFPRRVMYANQNYFQALLTDLLCYVILLIPTFTAYIRNSLTVTTVLWAMLLSSTISALYGLYVTKIPQTSAISLTLLRHWAKEGWPIARWLFGSSVVSWFSSYSLPYIAATFVGVNAIAMLRAAQTLTGLTNIGFRFIETTLTPQATIRYSKGGKSALTDFTKRWVILSLAVAIPILIFIVARSTQLMGSFFGSAYADAGWLLTPLSVTILLTIGSSTIGMALKATANTKPQFIGYLLAGIITLTLGPLFSYTLGLPGVAGVMVLNTLVIFIVVLAAYSRQT